MMVAIKDNERKGKYYIELPCDLTGEDIYATDDFEFEAHLELKITKKLDKPYNIDAYVCDDETMLLEITINSKYGRQYYKDIFFELAECVYHELLHYTQFPIPETAHLEAYEHHSNPHEVEALVGGFYHKATLLRVPLSNIMDEALGVVKDDITSEQREEILNLWMEHAKHRYPCAKY